MAVPGLGAQGLSAGGDLPRFPITGFEVEGVLPLPEARVLQVLAPYIRSDADLETLGAATQALEKALQAEGWGLYRLAVPPQPLNGPVRLQALRFELGRVDVQGNTRRDAAQILRALPVLQPGTTPNLSDLAVQTALSNDNPGKHVNVTLKPADQQDQVDALVQVAEQPDWTADVLWTNAGNAATGRDRLTAVLSHHNLWEQDHRAQLAYTTSLDRPGRVSQWGALYRWSVPRRGEAWGVSVSASDVVGDFGSFSSQGGGHALGLSWLRHEAPQGKRRSWWTAGWDMKYFAAGQTTAAGVVVASSARDRVSSPVSVGYNTRWTDGPVTTVAGVEGVVQPWGGSRLASYQTENPGISQAHWAALRGSLSHRRPLGTWQLEARVQGQWTSTALLAGEQFGVGGAQSVRGMAERPLAADNGLQASVEMGTPLGTPVWRGLVFADAAWLHNRSSTATSRVRSDQVASVGVGLRFSDQVHRQVVVTYGHVVNGSVAPYSEAPRRGDGRWHVAAILRF